MKKILNIIAASLMLLIISVSNAHANDERGGYAVVNPETGIVHGVIVTKSSDPFKNGGIMPVEYMGCPAGCIIVQQSTADKNGNVTGIHGPNITYDNNRNVFQVAESNTTQSQTVIESVSNTSVIETEISVSRSVKNYEFGVQDFRNSSGQLQFQMTEVAPVQNTAVEIEATTTEYVCSDREMACSRTLGDSSNTIVEESVLFNERSTSIQVQEKVIVEAKNKIREQLSLILTMLERWILD